MPQLPLEPELSLLSVSDLRSILNLSSSAPPLPLTRVEERELPLNGRTLTARLYASHDARDLPVVVYFHGGGFVLGTLATHDHICRKLALESGLAILAVDYRLAPEHGYPAAIDDAYETVRYVAEHGAILGVDGARLAVAGDSAGGNLAAVACLMARDRGGPTVAHQLLIYPVTDAACEAPSYDVYGKGFTLTADLMRSMWRLYLRGADPSEPYASPLRAPSLERLPSATVITAEYDALRDEGIAYADRLRQSGVEVVHQHCADLVHGFAAMWPGLEPARTALTFAGQRLAQAFRT